MTNYFSKVFRPLRSTYPSLALGCLISHTWYTSRLPYTNGTATIAIIEVRWNLSHYTVFPNKMSRICADTYTNHRDLTVFDQIALKCNLRSANFRRQHCKPWFLIPLAAVEFRCPSSDYRNCTEPRASCSWQVYTGDRNPSSLNFTDQMVSLRLAIDDVSLSKVKLLRACRLPIYYVDRSSKFDQIWLRT